MDQFILVWEIQKIIDSIEITWPNSSKSIIKGLNSNQTYNYSEPLITKSVKENENLEDEIKRSDKIINFNHKENKFIDFNIDRLIPEMISNEGPALSLSDVNNDGIDDFFVGGAKFQNSKIFISHDNKYIVDSLVFSKNRNSEDVASIFSMQMVTVTKIYMYVVVVERFQIMILH